MWDGITRWWKVSELPTGHVDESVLVFTDPAAADLIPWTSPREGLTQVTPDLPPSGAPPTSAPPS